MKLCDLETAKALQTLGYDGEYTKTYTDFDTCTVDVTGLKIPTEIPAPRLDDAAYWIRDKHPIIIEVDATDLKLWDAIVIETVDYGYLYWETYDTYDDALEAAVKTAIELIKNKKQ